MTKIKTVNYLSKCKKKQILEMLQVNLGIQKYLLSIVFK